jgi:hypothetical protein
MLVALLSVGYWLFAVAWKLALHATLSAISKTQSNIPFFVNIYRRRKERYGTVVVDT